MVKTFAEPMEDAGYIDNVDVDFAAQLYETLEEEFDVNLEEDILPWVGRSMAIGVWIPSELENPDDPNVVFSMSIRDRAAADEFLRSVGDPIDVSPMEDGDVYTPGDDPTNPMVLWIGDDLLLIASDRNILRQALDSRQSGSLLDDETFSLLINKLPSNRLAAVFIGTGFFESIADASGGLSGGAPIDMSAIEDIRGVAFSMSLPDAGLRFDIVQLLEEDATTGLFNAGDLSGVSSLPSNTIGYFGFILAEGEIQSFLDQFRDVDPVSYDDVAEQAEAELGFDLFGETLPSIGGENLVAVVSTRDGMLAEETGIPIGLLLSLGLVATGPMSDAIAVLEQMGPDEGVDIRSGTPSVAIVEGSELIAYQITDDSLVLGSASSVVDDFLAGDGGLADSELYQELNSELPGDALTFFVDLRRVFDLFEMSAADRAIAEPIKGVGAAYSRDGVILTGAVLILIDYLSE